MKNTKYFYFTIKGENLNVNNLYNEIDIKGEKYIKGEQTILNPTKEKIVQETNRWVYSSISKVDDDINLFLEEELKIIEKNLQVLKKYMIDNYCLIDYVIYVEDEAISKVNFSFSRSTINLLNKIGAEISISFIDW